MSIRMRLTAWYTCILAITLVIFGVAIYGIIYFNTYSELDKRIKRQADLIQPAAIIDRMTGTLEINAKSPQDAQIYVQVHNYTNGKTIYSKNLFDQGMGIPVPEQGEAARAVTGYKHITVNGHPYYVYEEPLNVNSETIGYLQVFVYTGPQQLLLVQLMNILLYGSIVMVVIAASLGMFLARKSMRPIGDVIEAADQIQHSKDLSVRINYDGPQDEIGQLINTVNRMLERVEAFYNEQEEAYAAQRRLVSDASHELRTPLTTIRGNVDLLKKMWDKEDKSNSSKISEEMLQQISLEAIEDIADEAKRMSRLVNDMLSLARADTGQTFDKDPIPLEPLITEVARRAQFLKRTAEWSTGDLSILNGVYVKGNKDYLQQMLFIFIENAFKYTPEGKVTMDAFLYHNQVGIRISDTGIGMDKDEVPHIFDRFYRADISRGITEGTGLGLSIAKWIIDEMEGSVEVVTQRDQGTTFIIWLPLIFPVPLE